MLLASTGSEYGFIGETLKTEDGSPFLRCYAITNIAWSDATRAHYEANAPVGLDFHNMKSLVGAVMLPGKPVIANDPATHPRRAGLPEGHPAMRAFLGVPLESRGGVIGMIGIANRPGGYDEQVIHDLRPILSTCADLIEAHQHDRATREA